MCEILLKVNHFAVDKGKSLICGAFHKSRDDPFIRVCKIPHDLFQNDF